MQSLTLDAAKRFAETNFKKLPELERGWNLLHSRYIIEAVKELTGEQEIIEKLSPLAWVHDIGKIENDENHAQLSVGILEKEFALDQIQMDCILNHGSSGKPIYKEAKIFQKADGISLFFPEVILYRFWAEAKEGEPFEKVKQKISHQYEKYLQSYADSREAIKILKQKYALMRF